MSARALCDRVSALKWIKREASAVQISQSRSLGDKGRVAVVQVTHGDGLSPF